MPEFDVVVREIHAQPYKVRADSLEEAKEKVMEGEGEMYLDDVVRIIENTKMSSQEKARSILELRYIGTDEENQFEDDDDNEFIEV